MFERFSPEGRQVVLDAKAQAVRLGHNFIGCEHLMLSLSASGTLVGEVFRELGLAPAAVEPVVLRLLRAPRALIDKDALAAIGIDLEKVTARIEEAFGPGALDCPPRRVRRRWRRPRALVSPAGKVTPFTPNAKKCLEGALRQAVPTRDGHIGVAHMAVSLLSMRAGMAPRILSELGVPAGSVISLVTERTGRAG
jgi:ATP-dependent Clp protease ATP-binding subunit ClpA